MRARNPQLRHSTQRASLRVRLGSVLRGIALFGAVGLGGATGCTSQNPEFSGPVCEPGERRCSGSGTQVCGRAADDSVAYIDEPCPATAACEAGRCTPPAGARACQGQTECRAGEVCALLVSTQSGTPAIATYCVAAQSAAAAPGASCTRDSDCQSYRCLQHVQGRYCLQACEVSTTCASRASCLAFNVTVNGVQGTVRSCSPQ